MTVITSPSNNAVKAARKLASRRGRSRAGAFLVEGPEVLREATRFLERVFVAEGADGAARAIADRAAAESIPVVTVTDGVLTDLADTVTPRGVIGVARLPRPEVDTVLTGASLALLCCAVADPGNLGTIVRTADAAGAAAVLVSRGGVDPHNPKAVRASAGSLFRLPVLDEVEPLHAVEAARRAGLRVIGAAADGVRTHTEENLGAPALLVLGGEAHGLPGEIRAACDTTVRIPMASAARPGYESASGRTAAPESLNLAATAAVLAFEAARRREAERPEAERPEAERPAEAHR